MLTKVVESEVVPTLGLTPRLEPNSSVLDPAPTVAIMEVTAIPPALVPLVPFAVEPDQDSMKMKRTRSRISKKIKPNTLDSVLSTDPDVAATPLPIANIILHLKCSMQDLNAYNESCKQQLRATSTFTYDPTVPPTIQAYNTERSEFSIVSSSLNDQDAAYTQYVAEPVQDTDTDPRTETSLCSICSANIITDPACASDRIRSDTSMIQQQQHIYTKLKKMKTLLYKNIPVTDNKSACFWCTYDFDTPECHIPFYNMNGQVHGYGVFCRPECAVGYLMKEHLDDSTKFERYHLLNRVYGKVFDYKKNIKPAPNPFYMLDRYGGNLTIEEYRALLQSNHILFTIDKPMTRTLPELHEETDDVITSMYENISGMKMCGSKTGIKAVTNHTTHTGGGTYKAKRQSEKVQHIGGSNHKANILREHFGLGQA
jgi:hypothetical protein